MNTLRRAIIALIILLIGTVTYAQQDNFPGDQVDLIEGRMAANIAELGLSEDQTTEYIEISRRYGEQMKALKHTNAKRMEKYQEMKAIRKDKNREMRTLLSDEQYKVYKEMQERQYQEMKQRRLNRH